MHDFIYVTRSEAKPVGDELIKIIHAVQDIVRSYFTFQFRPVGSSSPKINLITYDRKFNIGFDFDVKIEINDDNEDYTPEQIRHIMKNGINRVAPRYGYEYFEDSTRVLTIKDVEHIRKGMIKSATYYINL